MNRQGPQPSPEWRRILPGTRRSPPEREPALLQQPAREPVQAPLQERVLVQALLQVQVPEREPALLRAQALERVRALPREQARRFEWVQRPVAP